MATHYTLGLRRARENGSVSELAASVLPSLRSPSDASKRGCVTITKAADYLQIPVGLVEAAASYCREYREEIDRVVALNDCYVRIGLFREQVP